MKLHQFETSSAPLFKALGAWFLILAVAVTAYELFVR
jgi:hypothetical protein